MQFRFTRHLSPRALSARFASPASSKMLCYPKTLFIAAAFLSLALHADDWPQWRRPNRDGVYGETGLLKSFPAEGRVRS